MKVVNSVIIISVISLSWLIYNNLSIAYDELNHQEQTVAEIKATNNKLERLYKIKKRQQEVDQELDVLQKKVGALQGDFAAGLLSADEVETRKTQLMTEVLKLQIKNNQLELDKHELDQELEPNCIQEISI